MSNPYYSSDHLILNIGLRRSDTGELLSYLFVEQSLRDLGLDVRDFKLFQSNSEPTAVVVIKALNWMPTDSGSGSKYGAQATVQNEVAPLFKQEAVAVYDPQHGIGVLVGPKAAAWGDFDPQYFLMPDGRRLSEHNF